MDTEEKLQIAKDLQSYHYFFRAFWDIGNPIVDDFPDLPTAAIQFDSNGETINFLVNKTFWDSLNYTSKLFLVCHEMSHIILKHGLRFQEYINTPNFNYVNFAADVVINEMLCRCFKFNRVTLDSRISKEGCWIDTLFKDKNVPQNESTEYYFNLLKKETDEYIKKLKIFSIDKHVVLTEEQQKHMEEILSESDVLGTLETKDGIKLPAEFKNQVDSISRSASGTGSLHNVEASKKTKQKWETVIKKWEISTKKETIGEQERWDRINPRYSQIINSNIHLPTNNRTLDEYLEENKIHVFFFLDTSGSCISLAPRFFKAATSLDPKKFDVRLFCFDTKVVETDLNSKKVYGGGGTSFRIMEQKIQKICRVEKKKYPKAVFVITDGYGDTIKPEYPEKWHWFMTSNYTSCIPTVSKKYNLSNYE